MSDHTQPQQLLNLQSYGITRPDKIRWLYNVSANDVLSTIPSHSVRTLVSKAEQELQHHDVHYSHLTVTPEIFTEWYEHYQHVMTQKEYDIIPTPDWLQKKLAEGKQVGGFLYHQYNLLVGSLIYTQKNDHAYAAYKTSQDISELSKKHRSLGSIIDYLFIQEMKRQNMTYISLGTMRNAFGVINTLGNLLFKLRMGYQPIVDEGTPMHTSVPVSADGWVIFFGLQNQELKLYVCAQQENRALPDLTELDHFTHAIISLQELTYSRNTLYAEQQ